MVSVKKKTLEHPKACPIKRAIYQNKLEHFRQQGYPIVYIYARGFEAETIRPYGYADITYAIDENHSLYTSYSDIFKPQTERDIDGNYLDPIEGKNYEIGLKSESDNGALQSQVSIFRTEQDNLAQLDGGQIIPGTSLENAYVGAKGATSQGVEVEVTGELSDNLKATIGYTHFNAEDNSGKAFNTGYADTTLNLFATYDMNDIVPNLTVDGGID